MGKGLSRRVRDLKPSPTLAVNAKAKAMRAQGVDLVNLSAGEPDFDTPEFIKKAAGEAIDQGFTRYTPVPGIPELREAIVRKIEADYGLKYSPEGVTVTSGGKQAIFNAAMALIDEGDEVIILSPYWVSYPPIVEICGGRPVVVPTSEEKGFEPSFSAVAEAIGPKTKMIIINSPSNPTGVILSPEFLKAVAELALKHDFYILSDDIYDLIRFDGRSPFNVVSLEPRVMDRTLVVNGVSKTYSMTGWRLGWLVGPEDLIRPAARIQSQSTSNACSISQKAALAALTGPQDSLKEMVEVFRRRRDLMIRLLLEIPGVSCVLPQGSFYMFPNFSAYYGRRWQDRTISGSLDMADYLLEEARVACVPGIAFGEDSCIRLSFATSEEEIEKGISRIKEALAKLS
ncbi:pyridoxal phosphate-dependent aminotransferase [Thermosulfuriphilus sp.]